MTTQVFKAFAKYLLMHHLSMCTLWIVFSVFFAAPLKVRQDGEHWCRNFQIPPGIFNQIQVWALAGPLNYIHIA